MKIAIIKLSAMGDIIHSLTALQFIKRHIPDSQIDWIVEHSFIGILEDNPHIDNILPVNLKSIKKNPLKIFTEIKRLRGYSRRDYDIVIDAQGLIKSAISAKIISRGNLWGFCKESIREGEASYLYDNCVEIAYHANTIDRNMRVISEPLGFKITKREVIDKEPILYYRADDYINVYLNSDKKNIIFIVGSTWESRNYPKESFAKIADALQENILVLWGSEEEREMAEWIAYTSVYATAVPRLSYNDLKLLISRSDLLIGNDTGPTHIAWGLNIPSITIFGPTPVERVYQTNINRVIKSNSIIDHYNLNKNDFSIRKIEPNEIVKMAERLLYD